MAFSVLLSVYKKENADFLRASLQSVYVQTTLPDEVIVVEDGPLTPELYKVLDDFSFKSKGFKRVKLKTNSGLGIALNTGLEHCSNDIIARMDTDDIAKPDRFAKQLAVFEKNPNVGIVSSWIDEFVDAPRNVVSTRKLPQFHKEIVKYAKSRCPINHPAVMFRKSEVMAAGGYKPFPLFEDYYLWVRMLLNGTIFYNIPERLLYFRTSDDMYKRRGGLKHALDEIRFQSFMHKSGFISFPRYLLNISQRFIVRIAPNRVRALIYHKLLRK